MPQRVDERTGNHEESNVSRARTRSVVTPGNRFDMARPVWFVTVIGEVGKYSKP